VAGQAQPLIFQLRVSGALSSRGNYNDDPDSAFNLVLMFPENLPDPSARAIAHNRVTNFSGSDNTEARRIFWCRRNSQRD
jgi:hypothetical protein